MSPKVTPITNKGDEMKYEIKYHNISGDWLIFDMGDSFELIGIHNSEQDAKQHAAQEITQDVADQIQHRLRQCFDLEGLYIDKHN